MPSTPKKAAKLAGDAYEEGRRIERERCAEIAESHAKGSSYNEKLLCVCIADHIRRY